MRVPQVSERMKEAPAQALRGVFAGIGQLLLVTDKLRHKTPAAPGVPRTRAPEASAPAPAATEPATAVTPDVVVPDVVAAEVVVPDVAVPEVVVPDVVAAEVVAAEARKPARKPPARDFDKTGNVRLLAGEEDAEAAALDIPAVSADITPPPLPHYDELSTASLRARLRNLDIAQLKQVADYERSHQGRAEVIAMFERRVAKLEAEPAAGA